MKFLTPLIFVLMLPAQLLGDGVQLSPAWSFSNETTAAGLDYSHAYNAVDFPLEVTHISGGLAIGDLNGDGWDDIFAVTGYSGSADMAAPNSNPNVLFIANGDGTYTEQAGSWLPNPAGDKFSSGPLIADLNDDGLNDLLLGGVRTDGNNIRLYLNQNHTGFIDVTGSSGLGAILASQLNYGMAAGDTDGDGDLELFVAHWSGTNTRFLMQNNGSAVFTDVTSARLGATPMHFTFTPTFADINNNGSLDLLVASDFLNAASIGAGSRYFLNNGTGGFIAQGHPVPLNTGNRLLGPDENGMGTAVGDYDNDGDLDWFVTSIYDSDGTPEANWGVTGNRLYRNDGAGQFIDVTDTIVHEDGAGVRNGLWGWGACFGDFNNDMYLDLYHVNGFKSGHKGEPEFENDPARMFINNGDGTFTEQAAALGVADTPYGRAILCFDNDRDGDLDILVNNSNQTGRFFQNNLDNGNHYIQIKLVQDRRNHDAIGAKIELTVGPEPGVTQIRQVLAGGNFEASHPTAQHFGLGPNATITSITVTWPDGEQDTYTDVAADQYLVITRDPAAAVVPGAPMIESATPGNTEVTISFLPGFTGGSAITGYTVTSSPGGFTAAGATSPLTVTGLTNGVAYTFTVTATNAVGTGPASAASAPVVPKSPQTITFNNPGPQNFGTAPTLTATATSDLSPTFSSTTPGVCEITSSGMLTFVSAGSCNIDADQAGNSLYFPAPTVSQTFNVNAVAPGAPAIGDATPGDTQASVGFTPPGFTGGAAITGYTATSNPGGLTGFGAASPITVTGLTNGVAYTFAVTATNPAGTGLASASSNAVTPRGPQSITFDHPGPQDFGTTPILSAEASSGLSPTFSATTPGVCDITPAGLLSFVSAGTCSIDADQTGNSAWLPAPTVSQSFEVNAVAPGAPVIGAATPGDSEATVTFTPPAFTGGVAISGYTVTSNPEGLTGDGAASPIAVTGLTNGVAYTFTVTATNPAGTGPASGPSNAVTPRGVQTITFDPPGPQDFDTTPTLSATADSGLTPAFSTATPGVCGITSGGLLSFVTAGDCSIDADQAGNELYQPAETVRQTFAVNPVAPGAPTIGVATPGDAQASITFTPPEYTGGAAIDSYTVTSSPEGRTGTAAESPVTVTGLSQNVVYTFTVTATNPGGTGPASEPSNAIVVYVEKILSDGFEASQ